MKRIAYLLLCLSLLACQDDFLDTENQNAPDLETVLADPAEWESVIARQFNVIWQATQGADASITMAGMADVVTSSWANFWMLNQTSEPRAPIDNSEGSNLVEFAYYENFKVIGSVNDVLRLLEENPELSIENDQGADIREKMITAGLFLRGMAYANLALRYDQAQYVDETVTPLEAPLIPFDRYNVLLEKAITDLEQAIGIAAIAPTFELDYFNGVSLNKTQYTQLIRSLQARYRVLGSRNAAENAANDWQSILDYAREGIDDDFMVIGNGVDWYDEFKILLSRTHPFPFARVDYRVIAAMAEDTPSRFPTDGSHPLPEPRAIDQRLITDMQYEKRINFRPDRGLYHFSHYIYTRYVYHWEAYAGPLPWMLKAENDLMIAEALIRTNGDRQEAAALINLTRVGRGQLAELTGDEPDQQLLDAIMHERFVELLGTSGGQAFYDRRRLPVDDGAFHPYTGLQPGTPEQFPVPARELNALGMEVYTFGGK